MSLCVSDMEEVLTLPLQGAVARIICIAVAGRGDLELMATWRVELGCVTWGYCLLSLRVMVIQMRQSPSFGGLKGHPGRVQTLTRLFPRTAGPGGDPPAADLWFGAAAAAAARPPGHRLHQPEPPACLGPALR